MLHLLWEGVTASSSVQLPNSSCPARIAAVYGSQWKSALPAHCWLASLAVLIAAAAGLIIWRDALTRRPAAQKLIQFDVELSARGVIGSEVGTDVILSPAGARLVFVSLDADGVMAKGWTPPRSRSTVPNSCQIGESTKTALLGLTNGMVGRL